MYQALYRKYRPLNFDTVVGQSVIINALKNAILYNCISHAYLFSGPRGTGKTTVAKIFARSINCLEPVDGLACGKCNNCLYSFSTECMDIIEIDAASNNGVDEIRELRSKVGILPSELKYKVYIIDEVHMLSIGAFNALLKTIEEPPEHVIFILATTDPEKIPTTIISRCQWYNFKKIDNVSIVSRLQEIVDSEKINVEAGVLEKIASSADGGLRDAIGLLDKLYAYSHDKILLNDFYEVNGQINDEELSALKAVISDNNVKLLMEKIESYYQNGKNLIQVMRQLMISIKNDLFSYYINDDNIQFDPLDMIDLLNILNNSLMELKKSDDVRLSVEILFLHYFGLKHDSFNKEKNNKSISAKPKVVEKSVSVKPVIKNDEVIDNSGETKRLEENLDFNNFINVMLVRSRNIMLKASKDELNKALNNNNIFKDATFDKTTGYLACEILDGHIRAASVDGIIISFDYESMVEKMASHFDVLNNYYQKKIGSSQKIAIITNERWNELKGEYIELKREGKSFEYQDEPVLNKTVNNDKIEETISSNYIDEVKEMFGDIVEIK